ncbi:FSR family fosmidomycin resistance protein-like MFS transporter [Pseudochelatococcus contaminans]|uniref:FSR family fosmidomycin resistance protein-like MFS transporter n=2 Tax=Pseudochelatococcus contaminans TaxID=1538103 RepID=A0A7W5Z2R7_9HYPH|nr:FSR family fosmidomycin resistance protein-like MFS transporter [Pseudochelatococcus contaminans]
MSIKIDERSGEAAPPSVAGAPGAETTAFMIIAAISFCHMLNDIMQALFTSMYPIFKEEYSLDFLQIGMLTLAFQFTASLLQPLVGAVTDRRPMPYSLPLGMAFTFFGLLLLAAAHDYTVLVVAACLIGIGSSVFHPEASRVARLAAGGRHGLSQSLFQVGGNFGTAIGPLLAAFVVLPRGQGSVAWFSLAALLAMVILSRVSAWYSRYRRANASRVVSVQDHGLPRRTVQIGIIVLCLLTFSKNVYMASISSYYMFYLIDTFGVSVQDAQLFLFLFLGAAAAGTVIGGPIGDRFGRKAVLWWSVLGALPFSLMLPFVDLFWTAVLSVLIGGIMSSSFPAIVVFAQELVPGKVGMISGLFFGLAFGLGGLGAAVLGAVADSQGIVFVYQLCSFLPAIGLLTIFLPDIRRKRRYVADNAANISQK